MATTAELKRMRLAMEACGVDPGIIDQAVMSVFRPELFQLTTVVNVSSRDANRFFDEVFWPEYPKRDGGNPKEPTRKKIVAALISGENPDLILAGLRRLSKGLSARNKIGTEFVPMAMTWVNRKGWKDDPTPDHPAPGANGPTRPSGGGFFTAAAAIGRGQS